LVGSLTVGGPEERSLPPINLLDETGSSINEYIFDGSRIPKSVYKSSPKSDQLQNFKHHLSLCKSLKAFQNLFSNCLEYSGSLSMHIVQDLLQYFVDYIEMENDPNAAKIGWSILKKEPKRTMPINDQPIDQYNELGITMSCRYGKNLLGEESVSELKLCLKQLILDSSWKNHKEKHECGFEGFDWFSSTLAIIFQGNGPRTMSFQCKFSKYLSSTYLWHSQELDYFHQKGFSYPMSSRICHWVEAITELELPKVFSAILVSGCTTTQAIKTNIDGSEMD
jgi:hypothetical protein